MKSKWLKWQRGQAIMEYWPTIPAAIMIMIAGGLLVQCISGTLLTTVDYLDPSGLECQDQTPEDQEEGDVKTDSFPGPHSVELVSRVYNEENDTTTVAYKVTSGADPSISHWILSVPQSVYKNLKASSEATEWVNNDKKTGATGIKFDTGYAANIDDGGLMFVSHPARRMDSRTVMMTFAGYYDWDVTTVTIKAGQLMYSDTISAPSSQVDSPEEDDANECEVQ